MLVELVPPLTDLSTVPVLPTKNPIELSAGLKLMSKKPVITVEKLPTTEVSETVVQPELVLLVAPPPQPN